MTKYLFTFILMAQVSLSPAQAAGPRCLSYFKSQSAREAYKERFAEAFRDPEAYAEKLFIPGKSLKLKKHLGTGTTATLVLVQYGKKTYALKLTNTGEEVIPSSYKGMIINKFLGDAGVAPKIIGILSPSETKKWIKANEKALKEVVPKPEDVAKQEPYMRATTGLLMEVVKSALPRYEADDAEMGLKEYAQRGEPLTLEREFHAELVAQAQKIDSILTDLNITPLDADAIVTSSDKLILMDTGMYYSNPEINGHNLHWFEKFINKATKPEK